jgi:hypothetical protein
LNDRRFGLLDKLQDLGEAELDCIHFLLIKLLVGAQYVLED